MADGCIEWMLGLVGDDDIDRQDQADEEKGNPEPRQHLTLRARAKRALLPLLRRQRPRQPPRFRHGDWPRSERVGSRKPNAQPAHTKASLENLKVALANVLRQHDHIEDLNVRLATQRRNQALRLVDHPPIHHLRDTDTQDELRTTAAMVQALEVAEGDLRLQVPGLEGLVVDLTEIGDDVLVTPAFNDQVRALSSALRSVNQAEVERGVLSAELETREARQLQGKDRRYCRFRGWLATTLELNETSPRCVRLPIISSGRIAPVNIFEQRNIVHSSRTQRPESGLFRTSLLRFWLLQSYTPRIELSYWRQG